MLTDLTFAFQLEAYPDGCPAPTLLQKEVEMSTAAPFCRPTLIFRRWTLSSSHYNCSSYRLWERNNQNQDRSSVGANESRCAYSILWHVIVNQIGVAGRDNSKLFKLSQHPDIRPRPEGKKAETSKYNARRASRNLMNERMPRAMTQLSFVIGECATLESCHTLRLCCVHHIIVTLCNLVPTRTSL